MGVHPPGGLTAPRLESRQTSCHRGTAIRGGIRSICAVPLIVRGKSLGAISVLSETPDQYANSDGDYLREIANQVALAIENMKSFEEIAALKNRLEAENVYLQEEIRTEHNFVEIIGNSQALLPVLHKVEQIAPTDATVLILGETGTGKELIARAIHDRSPRKGRALVKVNCSAISAGLVESELFGHVKGAFTGAIERRIGRFELADGGTIFLDEIGELPADTQVKLLRVLQEQEFEPVGSNKTMHVNVRIIAATNRNLEEAVERGSFSLGSLLPAQRRPAVHAAAPRPPVGHSAVDDVLSGSVLEEMRPRVRWGVENGYGSPVALHLARQRSRAAERDRAQRRHVSRVRC